MVRVEMSGLEPLAFGLRNRRSSRLSYTPGAAPEPPGIGPGGGDSTSQRAWSGHTPFPPGWSALFGVHTVQLSIGMHVHP